MGCGGWHEGEGKEMDVRSLPLQWPKNMSKEAFYVGQSNVEAYEWVQRWPWPHAFLCLYGPSGCGKTHLASMWAQERHACHSAPLRMVCESIEDEGCYVWDGAVSGWTPEEEEHVLFMYNTVVEKRGTVLWTSLTPPAAWCVELLDLRSRIKSMPCVPVHAPDDAVLTYVLCKCFQEYDLPILPDVIAFMMHFLPRSFEDIHHAMKKIHEYLLGEKKKLTLHHVKRALLACDI